MIASQADNKVSNYNHRRCVVWSCRRKLWLLLERLARTKSLYVNFIMCLVHHCVNPQGLVSTEFRQRVFWQVVNNKFTVPVELHLFVLRIDIHSNEVIWLYGLPR